LDKIEETFGLNEVRTLPSLQEWLAFEHASTDYEIRYLTLLQDLYKLGGDEWNEVELENKIISPLIVFSEIDTRQFAYFIGREISATLGEHEISGKVDGMIATGFRSPKKPCFCISKYKQQTDPHGDPRGQTLATMLAIQRIHGAEKPIFGCCIIRSCWQFMVLEGVHYAISNTYQCTTDKIFDTHRILRGLWVQIEKLIA
jgi:hypothetical protein